MESRASLVVVHNLDIDKVSIIIFRDSFLKHELKHSNLVIGLLDRAEELHFALSRLVSDFIRSWYLGVSDFPIGAAECNDSLSES